MVSRGLSLLPQELAQVQPFLSGGWPPVSPPGMGPHSVGVSRLTSLPFCPTHPLSFSLANCFLNTSFGTEKNQREGVSKFHYPTSTFIITVKIKFSVFTTCMHLGFRREGLGLTFCKPGWRRNLGILAQSSNTSLAILSPCAHLLALIHSHNRGKQEANLLPSWEVSGWNTEQSAESNPCFMFKRKTDTVTDSLKSAAVVFHLFLPDNRSQKRAAQSCIYCGLSWPKSRAFHIWSQTYIETLQVYRCRTLHTQMRIKSPWPVLPSG